MISFSLDELYQLLIILFSGFVLMCVGIYLKKIYELSSMKIENHTINKYESILHEYILNGTKVGKIPKKDSIRNYILNISKKLSGEEKNRAVTLYKELGFLNEDLIYLESFRYRKRVRALNRIQIMDIKLDEKLLEGLLTDSNITFRWMALDLYVQTHKEKAFISLLKFVQDEENLAYRGVIYQLMSKYAQFRSQDLVFILTHLPNLYILELVLKVLEIYPVAEVKEAILSQVRGDMGKNILVSAIRILSNFPDERLFYFFDEHYDSKDWDVRLNVAKVLGKINDEKSVEILKKMTLDENYIVRNNACMSLVDLNNGSGNNYITKIFKDKNHPSNRIIHNIYSLREFKEA